ncbi:MAG TPA: ABC transporter substrate-binding protein [Candidatus Limnocylindria bacterium]|nr:ABC transporter substrate-binding protein [Candidatus Limnocylindria bacterium]
MKRSLWLAASINLRACWTFVPALLLTAPGGALAQAPAPARIGVLVQEMGRSQSQAVKGMSEELKRLGYRERKNLFFETRNVKGNRAALQPAAAELVGKNVSVVFTTGTSATRAAMAATNDIPVVFVYPGNPMFAGIVKSIEEHAKNVTGVAAFAAQAIEKRLALFKQIMPPLQTIVVFYDVNNSFSRDSFKRAESAAKNLGLRTTGYGVKSADELKATVASLRAEKGMAIFQVADELAESEAEFLFATARAKKLATMFNEESWVIAGALAAYGPSYIEMGRQAARLIDRIIKGERPQTLPLERASKFDLTLNFRTANAIGLRLPEAMLKQAERVIR